uniref:Reverse transcriptase domain-containing protein n=1 Tax=Moniliophthora roreri TaxID=221103 RepID=A0A0W0FWW9_MONRR
MDDILIFSKDQDKHKRCTERLMHRLKKHNLFLKPEKCEFDVTEVVFLGMVIRPGYIAMDPIKLAGIADWEPPQTVKGVRAFLGFGNFYRKFVGKYAHLTRPLNDLLQKNWKFKWTTQCQLAFDLLKAKFLSKPILVMPDVDKPFIIEADASKWAMGAVLRQKGADGEWHPWLIHVPGKSISQADTLSRRSNEQDDADSDNEDIVVLPDQLFIKGIDLGMKEDIAEQLGLDDFHKSALEQLLHQGMPPIKSTLSDWKIEGDLLFFQNRVYVPNNIDLCRRIVQSIHETPGVGHPGQWNTIEQVQRDFWWPEMAKFIRSFVDGCVICQQSKINTHPTRTPIQPIQVHRTPSHFKFAPWILLPTSPNVMEWIQF